MPRTTIARDLIAMIKLGTADKEQVLRHLADASRDAEALRHGPPAATVRFYALRTPAAIAAQAIQRGRSPLARGTGFKKLPTVEAIYDLKKEVPLYALNDANRVDVLRFGRHPDQDVQLPDMLVSREHGLIIFSESYPLFCDYGSLKNGVHAGSTNGTWLDGASRTSDAMIPWFPMQTLMLGQQYRDHSGQPCYAIKIAYELHPVAEVAPSAATPTDDGNAN